MATTWQNMAKHGKDMANTWQTHGKDLANTWQHFGQTTWPNMAQTLQNMATHGKSWQTHDTRMANT